MKRACEEERGQALVELALALPILLFLLVGGTDLARVFSAQTAVQGAARVGAEAASLDFASPADLARAELAGSPGLNAATAVITVAVHDGGGVDGTCAGTPTLSDPCFATVRVLYQFRTVIAWPGLPNVIGLDQSRTFRRS